MSYPKILVVDDVRDIVEEMIQMLELLDLIAVGTGSVGSAIEQLSAHPEIRVVVSDLRLAGESGTEIPARVAIDPRLAGRAFDYVFMTGDSDHTRISAAMPDSVVLTKPINPRALIAQISSLLEGKAGTS